LDTFIAKRILIMKEIKDPGIGYNSKIGAQRLINNDGTSNIIHHNSSSSFSELYTYLITISWGMFFMYVFLGYILINALFALGYLAIGIEQITTPSNNMFEDFMNACYFSAQSLTTVGYGAMSPKGTSSSLLAAFEALTGLLSFSFITGLLYGRFSKPTPSVEFSNKIILREFNGGTALMFRLMNVRKSMMIEPSIQVTMSIPEMNNNGEVKRSFYILELERSNIMYLPTMWTIVHQINDESPLSKYSKEELKNLNAELFVLVNYYEQSFTQKLYQLYNYSLNDLEFNKKFVSTINYNTDGFVVLDHLLLNKLENA